LRPTLIALTAIPAVDLHHRAGLPLLRPVDQHHDLGGLAIAIGELVDDAVVDVENILRRLKQNRARHPSPLHPLEVVRQASLEVRSGIVYATVIIVLVFVPLFALPGIEGGCSCRWASPTSPPSLASLLVSVTVTPVLATTCCRR
jgi:heavy-metal exporter, HME family